MNDAAEPLLNKVQKQESDQIEDGQHITACQSCHSC